jgi:hypothetical protein
MFLNSYKTLNKHNEKQIKDYTNPFFYFFKVVNILGIIIEVDKCTKKARITCHGLKRFDVISILNHF